MYKGERFIIVEFCDYIEHVSISYPVQLNEMITYESIESYNFEGEELHKFKRLNNLQLILKTSEIEACLKSIDKDITIAEYAKRIGGA